MEHCKNQAGLILKDWIGGDDKAAKIKVGVTHEEGGKFDKWLQEIKTEEERSVVAAEFWDKLNNEMFDDIEICEYIDTETGKHPWLVQHYFPPTPTTKKYGELTGGVRLITEYLCELESIACVHGTLHDMIEKKAPVSDKCYESLTCGAIQNHYFCLDIFKCLVVKSGYVPTKEIKGMKPLDYITDFLSCDDEEEREDGLDMLKKWVGPNGTHASKVKVGVTHKKDGHYETWLKEAKREEEEEGKDKNNNTAVAGASPIALTTTTADLQQAAKKKKNKSKNKKKKHDGPCCPVNGCNQAFTTESDLQQHIERSKGKAHTKYYRNQQQERDGNKRCCPNNNPIISTTAVNVLVEATTSTATKRARVSY